MITLYDIPSKVAGNFWSPNTIKTRISLNYKGLQFKTEWVEYPDIEPVLKKIGGAPTDKKDDGSDLYTLPAIHDDKTGKVIVDSLAIALYLDETYPDTPKLFPPGSRAAIHMHGTVFMDSFPIWNIALPASNNILNPKSEAYFRKTREQKFGKKLEELAPPGPVRDEVWATVKAGMERLGKIYDKNGEGKPFFFGDTFSYADANTAAFILWVRIVVGAENNEWKAVEGWSGGRWAGQLEATKKFF